MLLSAWNFSSSLTALDYRTSIRLVGQMQRFISRFFKPHARQRCWFYRKPAEFQVIIMQHEDIICIFMARRNIDIFEPEKVTRARAVHRWAKSFWSLVAAGSWKAVDAGLNECANIICEHVRRETRPKPFLVYFIARCSDSLKCAMSHKCSWKLMANHGIRIKGRSLHHWTLLVVNLSGITEAWRLRVIVMASQDI